MFVSVQFLHFILSWLQGNWLGDVGNATVDLVAYDTPGLGDTYGKDPKTLRGIAEEIEAKENGPFNAFLLVVKVDYFFENGLTDWLIVVTLRYDQRCTLKPHHLPLLE